MGGSGRRPNRLQGLKMACCNSVDSRMARCIVPFVHMHFSGADVVRLNELAGNDNSRLSARPSTRVIPVRLGLLLLIGAQGSVLLPSTGEGSQE